MLMEKSKKIVLGVAMAWILWSLSGLIITKEWFYSLFAIVLGLGLLGIGYWAGRSTNKTQRR